ncbi:MAG: hypothetical protein HY508_03455 [Acidobacteria bacterium]|nr:hypothetical protein [Acidobacteriota bacterium]
MKIRVCLWMLVLLAVPVAGAQDSASAQEPANPPASQQEPSQKPAPRRPTLGPTPPTLQGPKTFNTTDPRRLVRVKKIYVERMENGLQEKLIVDLAKIQRFSLVNDYSEADAVLRGTCLDMRRLKTLRSEVYLNEVKGASIWQDNVRRPINPPSVEVAVAESAKLIAAHLVESLVEAERH